jgi:hypothetical protein
MTGIDTVPAISAMVSYSAAPLNRSARATVNGQQLDAGRLCNAGDAEPVPIRGVGAGANFQCDRHGDSPDHRLKDAGNQCFIGEQSGAGGSTTDLFGGATHINVDDLRAEVRLIARRCRQLQGVVAHDLHRAYPRARRVLLSLSGFSGLCEAHVG